MCNCGLLPGELGLILWGALHRQPAVNEQRASCCFLPSLRAFLWSLLDLLRLPGWKDCGEGTTSLPFSWSLTCLSLTYFIQLEGREQQRKTEIERERELPFCGSLRRGLPQPGLGQAGTRNLELCTFCGMAWTRGLEPASDTCCMCIIRKLEWKLAPGPGLLMACGQPNRWRNCWGFSQIAWLW